jgi:hypothetical protein
VQEPPPSPPQPPSAEPSAGGAAVSRAAPASAAAADTLGARRRASPGAALLRGVRGVRRFFMALCGFPSGRWPAPTVASLLAAAVLLVGAVELLPKALSDVTLSIRARTEVLELELDPVRSYVWWLPAGTYSLLTAKDGAGCRKRHDFDVACEYAEPTAITIENGATVRFEVIPPAEKDGPPRFTAALTPRAAVAGRAPSTASSFELHDAADTLLVATRDLVTFESGPVDLWRIPLILKRVQVGEFLSESISTADTLGAVRQPIMTQGDVRIFARSIGSHDRYQIQEERFDPADVVQIPADAGHDGELLLGLLSLDRDGQHSFDVTMHTALAEIFVRRLGAEHRIGVSMWSIVSQLPIWAALWIVWVSLIVVANYHAARLQQLQGEPNEKQSA